MSNHLRPGALGQVVVTPDSAGWRFLSFGVTVLKAGEVMQGHSGGNEMAFVPQTGAFAVEAGGQVFELSRESVFAGLPHVLYLPPG
ncbi:5-deoxy-glucuronate isomerase, partial [Deinococcus sp.]|uniref:5-deoxy-glucuronate isomerase n=1 Tax=Deinococcus sp. TaxID=47478 RepID=UPI00286E19E4